MDEAYLFILTGRENKFHLFIFKIEKKVLAYDSMI